MFMIIYILLNQVKFGRATQVQYTYSVCVDRGKSSLEQLESFLFLIISESFQMVSYLRSIQVQHQTSYNLQSI